MKRALAAATLSAAFLLPLTFSETAVAPSSDQVRPLLIGATVPPVTLVNGSGEAVELGEVLSRKPTVVVFYRGGW